MTAPASVFNRILQEFGVDVGDPERRAQKAQALADGEFAPEEVEVAFKHLEATSEPGKAPRMTAFMVMNPSRLRAVIADAVAYRGAKIARSGETVAAHPDKPYVPGPTEGEPREVWEHDRMCRIAWCRVNGDKRPVAEVAREIGVSPTTLGVMLDRGRTLSASPIVAAAQAEAPAPTLREVAKAERAGEKRIEEFRNRMHSDGKSRRLQQTQQSKGLADWNRIEREQGKILAGIRERGTVDLAAVVCDPTARGALAELEFGGHVLRNGPPDARQMQPYRVAKNDQERAEFREQFHAWARQDSAKPRSKGVQGS